MSEPRVELRALSNQKGIAYAEVVELWMERAAIREFDGGMSRDEAESAALVDVENRLGAHPHSNPCAERRGE